MAIFSKIIYVLHVQSSYQDALLALQMEKFVYLVLKVSISQITFVYLKMLIQLSPLLYKIH